MTGKRSHWLKAAYGVAVLFFALSLFMENCVFAKQSSLPDAELKIALDPGHGGEEDGACYYGVKEKDANLKVANLVKKELEQYSGVSVVLTRNEDETVNLAERARRAAEAGADLLISLHFNASVSGKSKGASVYISTGEGERENLRKLADNLLGELESLGLENAGTFARVTQMGGRRADGSFDDYYGVLRHAYNNGIPSLLIEHCYMDSEEDKVFLRSEENLEKLAKADAEGIAAYYGLEKKDGTKPVPKHAKIFGGTTKGIELNAFEAPNISSIRLVEYDGSTPGIATYEVEVEDQTELTSLYLVYQNGDGGTATISFALPEGVSTGCHVLKAYIPEYLSLGNYALSYIGAYNAAGYDAGYNYTGGSMIGFGKCDWLNSFSYQGEADFSVTKEASISTAHANFLNYEIQIGLRDRRNIHLMTVYPN